MQGFIPIYVGLLLPLSARGYVRRENIIPYILGANISTLADTLIAGALLGDPRAMTVVLAHVVCACLGSSLIVLLAYWPYLRRFLSCSSTGRLAQVLEALLTLLHVMSQC